MFMFWNIIIIYTYLFQIHISTVSLFYCVVLCFLLVMAISWEGFRHVFLPFLLKITQNMYAQLDNLLLINITGSNILVVHISGVHAPPTLCAWQFV